MYWKLISRIRRSREGLTPKRVRRLLLFRQMLVPESDMLNFQNASNRTIARSPPEGILLVVFIACSRRSQSVLKPGKRNVVVRCQPKYYLGIVAHSFFGLSERA